MRLFARMLMVGAFSALSLVTGCTTSHLDTATVSNIVGVDEVQTRAVMANLSKFIDDPRAIPAHSMIRNGASQITYQIEPELNFGLSPGRSFSLSSTGSTQETTTRLGASSWINGSFQELQNLQFTPITDGNALRNLQALYRHAVYGAPLIGAYTVSRVFVNEKFYPNPFELQEPNCVLCARAQGAFSLKPPRLYENRKLKAAWLKWDLSDEAARAGDYVSLGRHGAHELFVSRADRDAGVVSDFILYTFGVAPPQMSFPTSDLPILGTLGANGVENVGPTPGSVGASRTSAVRPFSP